MHKVKRLIFIKLLLLIWAMILAWWLLFTHHKVLPAEESTIIILDVGTGMMKQDITTNKGNMITRLDAAKKIITKIISDYPQRSFWLITYGSKITYVLPPTTDSGNYFQYVNSLLVESGNTSQRSTWLLGALEGKNIIVLWHVDLPKSLLTQSQTISLTSYMTDNPPLSTSQHLNLSASQFEWLITILCLLLVLVL